MKKQINSLKIQKNPEKRELHKENKISLLLLGIFITVGLCCTLHQEWNLGNSGIFLVILSVILLSLSMFFSWEKTWHTLILLGSVVLLLLVGVFQHGEMANSLAAFLEKFYQWKFLHTGMYHIPYETKGNLTWICFLLACFLGFTISQIIRSKSTIGVLLMVFPIFIVCMFGWIQSGWWICIYLLGILLLFVKFSSGDGKVIYVSAGILVLLTIVISGGMWLGKAQVEETRLSRKIEDIIHSFCWEKKKNPMPEGNFHNFGAYRPKNEPTLEITMEKWMPFYVRGYVAGEYTKNGWETIPYEKLENFAEEFYTIQKNYFFPGEQISKAYESVGEKSENSLKIRVLDACHVTTYLPYTVGNFSTDVLNPFDLGNEGMARPKVLEYYADLYPLENSYLLQEKLLDAKSREYRSAESAYRNFVEQQYLTIPKEIHQIMKKYVSVDGDITTVQAKRSITKLLGETLTYNEDIETNIGKQNFPEYVLEVSRQGYSVHYATLATLFLRCYGIPARYVEGYVVTPKQADMMVDGETLTLTQYDSHAWAEYYLDGVGWLPFDATPGYETILEYELPLKGIPTGNQELETKLEKWKKPDPDRKQEKIPILEVEEKETKKSPKDFIKEAITILFLLVFLVFIGMILRTIYLRYQLRKRWKKFYHRDHRVSCACILSYMQDLSGTLRKRKKTDSENVKEQILWISRLLGEDFQVSELETMINEIWFSHHQITHFHQKTALLWLNTARGTWKKENSMMQRFYYRFITCKVL